MPIQLQRTQAGGVKRNVHQEARRKKSVDNADL